MLKLTKIESSLADFEGDIRGLRRQGRGIQTMGQFGTLAGSYQDNKPEGQFEFRGINFPVAVRGSLDYGIVTNQFLDVGQGLLTFDGDLGPNLNPLKGILKLGNEVEVHLIITEGRISELILYRAGGQYDPAAYQVRTNIVFPTMNTETPVMILNQSTGLLSYSRYGADESPTGQYIEVDLFNGTYAVKVYDKGAPMGLQAFLDFRSDVPSIKSFEASRSVTSGFKVVFADGKIITLEDEKQQGVLRVNGTGSYITGPMKGDRLEGQAKLLVDGRLVIPCEVTDNKLVVANLPSLFNAIEGNEQGDSSQSLNGFVEHDFGNGLVYNGFFQNDFVYCHKDAFPSCIRDRENGKRYDLVGFLNSTDWFEGTIEGVKAAGVVKVKYRNGLTYTGCLDDRFLKVGKGQVLFADGSMFIGSFKDDLFHGFGRMIQGGRVTLGLWHKGVLKFEIDPENLNVSDMKDLENLADYLDGGMTLDQVRDMLEKRRKERSGGHVKDDLAKYFKNIDRKKLTEEGKALQAKSEQLVMMTIFHFKNGYAYHGKVIGNFILDKDVGDVITPTGDRIKCRYKAMHDLNMGAFKSLDGREFYMFNYDKRMLGEVKLEEMKKG